MSRTKDDRTSMTAGKIFSCYDHARYLQIGSKLAGVRLTEDVMPYEDWLHAVHELLPGLPDTRKNDTHEVEGEILKALKPAPAGHPGIPEGYPLCMGISDEEASIPIAASLAYALACAAWDPDTFDPRKERSHRIYEGADDTGDCWAVGFAGPLNGGRAVFEYLTTLSSISCDTKEALISLWATVCAAVGPALPEPTLKVRLNSYIDTEDLNQYAALARAQANLAEAAEAHGLYWMIDREGGHVDLRIQGEEYAVIPAVRELVARGEDPYFVDVPCERTYQRIHQTYGPKESGGEGLFYEVDVDPF